MNKTNNPPADTIRYGALKAVIWRNVSQDDLQKVHYSVNYIRSYKDTNGEWQDSTSFSEVDNLKIGQLIPRVAMRLTELKAKDRQNNVNEDFETEVAA